MSELTADDPSKTGCDGRPDRLERMGHRLRWLFVLWIVGWWANFLYQAGALRMLGSKVFGKLL